MARLPITLITSIKMVISPVVSTSVSARAPTAIMNKPLHPVTREADMEVPFLLKEMLS